MVGMTFKRTCSVLPTAEFPSNYPGLRIKHFSYKVYGFWCTLSLSPVRLCSQNRAEGKCASYAMKSHRLSPGEEVLLTHLQWTIMFNAETTTV